MIRLFIGIDPPDIIKEQLLLLNGGISAARWQRRDQLHMTLRFVGEVNRHLADDLAAAMSGLSHPKIEARLDGTGTFDKMGKIHTLFARVTPEVSLRGLHNKIDQALTRIGIEAESRTFTPHITLARLNHRRGDLAGFMTQSGGVTSAPFLIEDVCLYQSTLAHGGSVYAILERYALI
jgi:RNA 2',3'-cyclic 3'-phosphodiesterase